MQDGISFGDILFLAILAVFIYTRFMGHKLPKGKKSSKQGRVIDFPKTIDPVELEQKAKDVIAGAKQSNINADDLEGIAKIKALDASFNEKEFIKGTQGAFEMYFDALQEQDEDTLDALLAPRLFDKTVDAFEDDEKNGHKMHAEVRAIKNCEMTDVRVSGKTLIVDVLFKADIVQYKLTEKNTLKRGDTKSVKSKSYIWTLARSLNSNDPNWEVEDIQTPS